MQPMVIALLLCKLYPKLYTGLRLLIQMCLICLKVPIVSQRIIHLVSTQNFSLNSHYLLPDTHAFMSVSGVIYYFFGKLCICTKGIIPK